MFGFVEEYYDASCEAFKGWREAGSPREGPIALHMRTTRALFKRMLKECKKRHDDMRAEALARKYRNMEGKDFWGEINSIKITHDKSLHTVDGLTGEENIVNMWRNHSNRKLNCLDNSEDARRLEEQMSECSDGSTEVVSISEVKCIVKNLPDNNAVGLDGNPNEVYKKAPNYLLHFLTFFFFLSFYRILVRVGFDVLMVSLQTSRS